MKHIKGFNEDVSSFAKEIRELCNSTLIYLVDEGFSFYTDLESEGETLLYINGSKEVKFIDILPDLQQFIELLLNISIIKDINVDFYYKSLNGYELGITSSSRNVRESLNVDKILNGDFSSGTYNTKSLIILRFELERKKVPFLKKIKSFFQKY